MRLALGTAQFGMAYGIANQSGKVSRSAVKAMLQLASASGIDLLDTATDYGDSEDCLGEVGSQDFQLVTKLSAVPDRCRDVNGWVLQEVADSLARLGVQKVYGLLLHHPGQLLEADGSEIYHALQILKGNGKIKKIGISIYGPNALEALLQKYSFDLVQAPFNLVDRRLKNSGWLHRLKNEGVEIHTRSAFLQGLLLMPESEIPARFAPWSDLWKRWHEWLLRYNVSAVQACLAFPLSFTEVDRVIVGAESLDQLRQVINSATVDTLNNFPDLNCEVENLINPSRWSRL